MAPEDSRPKPAFLNFEGIVRLLVDAEPWRLLVNLRGLSLSEAGILAELSRRDVEGEMGADDLDLVLPLGFSYTLQIEHPSEALPVVVTKARLTDRQMTAGGLQLYFGFEGRSKDLDVILDELGRESLFR